MTLIKKNWSHQSLEIVSKTHSRLILFRIKAARGEAIATSHTAHPGSYELKSPFRTATTAFPVAPPSLTPVLGVAPPPATPPTLVLGAAPPTAVDLAFDESLPVAATSSPCLVRSGVVPQVNIPPYHANGLSKREWTVCALRGSCPQKRES